MINTVLCYLEKDGKYLMLHRTKKEGDINRDKWIGIGGKLEEKESPEECLVREAYEETGYHLISWSFRAVITFVCEEITEQMYLFSSRDFTGEEKVCDEGDLEWVPKEDILNLPLWEGDRIFLRRLWDNSPFFTLTLHYDRNGHLTKRIIHEENYKDYLTFKKFDAIPWIMNAFSTRRGGVSEGRYARMNLSFSVGDDPDRVVKNFRILGEKLGVPAENMVMAHQTHTANVMPVENTHRGMGIVKDRSFCDIDGIMTGEEGLCLVTSHADCVPLYFVDPVNHAIALAHSGWKGTAGNICKNTVEAMKSNYGTNPKDLVTVIGPAIGVECYEVGPDVAGIFRSRYSKQECEAILHPKDNGKYDLDLPRANLINMVNCGIQPENIEVSDICTCCCHDWMHSHRGSGGKRGGMAAFLMIRSRSDSG